MRKICPACGHVPPDGEIRCPDCKRYALPQAVIARVGNDAHLLGCEINGLYLLCQIVG